MRSIYGIGSLITQALMDAATINALKAIRLTEVADFSQPKRRRTGKKYPHSSARQKARYARHIAAGQISFISHGPSA